MGVQAGKTNTDTTGESNGESQYSNSGGQSASGVNQGYNRINYLDPDAITGQKSRYGGLLDQSQGNTDSTFGAASQFYGSLLNSPGYDSGTKNAISAIGNAAANEKLDEGKAAAERHAAATGNDAGYTAGLANLYGQGARDTASRANANELAFYQEQQRQKELGGAGMERLYGTAQGAQLGLLGGLNNLSTLHSGSESGGAYSNEGSQYGNGSATNRNTSHQAGQSTTTGGSGDAANGIGNLLNSLLGGGGSGSKGGLGGALGDALKSLFGGGKNGGQQGGSWTNPNSGYGGLPYGQQGGQFGPGFTGENGYFDENGNWVTDPGLGNYGDLPPEDAPWDYGYEGAPDPGSIDWNPWGDPEDGSYGPGYYNDPWGEDFDPYGGLENWGSWD